MVYQEQQEPGSEPSVAPGQCRAGKLSSSVASSKEDRGWFFWTQYPSLSTPNCIFSLCIEPSEFLTLLYKRQLIKAKGAQKKERALKLVEVRV